MTNETKKITEITSAEWSVMRVVWTLGSCTARQIIDQLQQESEWKDSTIKTLLNRLVKKGLLSKQKVGKEFEYAATVNEQVAMDSNVQNLFANMCAMKNGKALVALLKTLPLSQTDIKALQTELNKKAATAPENVPCDCLPGDDCCTTEEK